MVVSISDSLLNISAGFLRCRQWHLADAADLPPWRRPVTLLLLMALSAALIGGTQISTGTSGPPPADDDHPRVVPCSNPFEKISDVDERG